LRVAPHLTFSFRRTGFAEASGFLRHAYEECVNPQVQIGQVGLEDGPDDLVRYRCVPMNKPIPERDDSGSFGKVLLHLWKEAEHLT